MGIFGKLFGKTKQAAEAVVDSAKELGDKVIDAINPTKLKERKEVLDQVILSLDKRMPDTARVMLVLDKSYSMDSLYYNGAVQEIVERVLPLGMKFDDNGAIDVYSFSSRGKAKYHGEMTEEAGNSFVKNKIMNVEGGGTYYSEIINMLAKEGKGSKEPLYVIFVTDGDCTDRNEATEAITKAAKQPVFFQFVGIGGASFSFLEKLDDMEGRFVDNANFFAANDISQVSDEQLYTRLLGEYPDWCKKAKDLGIY